MQELCILLEDYWERMNLKVPIYFSTGLQLLLLIHNSLHDMLLNFLFFSKSGKCTLC